jgi:23S rRNA A2030 N6-methylase RlmJ
VFVVNPPFVLAAALKEALPHMVKAMAQDEHAGFVLEQGR